MTDADRVPDKPKLLRVGSGLYVLLTISVVLSCAVLAMTLKQDVRWDSEPGAALHAYGPEDYPKAFPEELNLSREAPGKEQGTTYAVPPPPFSQGMFPCSDCHKDWKTNPKRRPLRKQHDNITLNHGDRDRWCFDCHNPDDRDMLRLANGSLVPFTESYKLCGQCHGDIYRDWRAGIHGRRRGFWDGPKQYLLCAHCHDPHSPRYKKRTPLAPPVRPDRLRETR